MLCNGPGYACRIETFSSRFWMNFKKALPIIANLRTSYISKTMTPNTPAKRPRNGSKTMDSLFCNGLHSLQTLIQLSIFGNTSKGGWGSMKYHQMGCWSYGREWRLNGISYLVKCVRTSLRVCLEGLRLY